MRRSPRLLLAATVLILLAAACAARSSNVPRASGDQTPYPTGSDQLVLRIDSCCGFTAYEYTLKQFPFFSLFGDGQLTVPGPQIEIYPGPALPNIQQSTVTDAGIRAILDEARTAGLYASHDYTEPMTISDAPTTIFTVVEADGTKHVTRAYALTESNDDGLPQEQREARHKLRHFMDQMGRLREWLPQGSISDEESYTPTAVRVFSRELTPQDESAEPKQEPKAWPLDQPLATFGAPVEGQPGFRCEVVTGSDLDTLLPEAQRSNELTPWTSEGTGYRLIFRPLLPDESGC